MENLAKESKAIFLYQPTNVIAIVKLDNLTLGGLWGSTHNLSLVSKWSFEELHFSALTSKLHLLLEKLIRHLLFYV